MKTNYEEKFNEVWDEKKILIDNIKEIIKLDISAYQSPIVQTGFHSKKL